MGIGSQPASMTQQRFCLPTSKVSRSWQRAWSRKNSSGNWMTIFLHLTRLRSATGLRCSRRSVTLTCAWAAYQKPIVAIPSMRVLRLLRCNNSWPERIGSAKSYICPIGIYAWGLHTGPVIAGVVEHHRARAGPRLRRRRTEDLTADAASRRRNGDLGHADLGVELGGALRQVRRRERLLLADIAGADRMDHQVAQGHRRAHLRQEPVHGRGGIDGSILETPGPSGRWSTNGAGFCDALSTLAGMSSLPGLVPSAGLLPAPRLYIPPRGAARSAMFRPLRMRLLCDPSTWHSTAGPASKAHRSRSMSPRPDLGPKPRLGYAASSIERAAERRADAAALAALEND